MPVITHRQLRSPASSTSAPRAATCATRSPGSSASWPARSPRSSRAASPRASGRSASAQAGPRLLTLGQLERIRDELADRVAALRANRGAELLAADARARRSATAGSS